MRTKKCVSSPALENTGEFLQPGGGFHKHSLPNRMRSRKAEPRKVLRSK
ncbi:hypothetical protein RISK_006449 [Rhodopirellula islandica]|uniref:Uncharacterized protein n=1 Tax=Rhodopirellula islandica TaxID=595434 RepID=A0A0J1B3V5_RHOIS|nr:hypothetical protein RISK_006449 [Rhodopirellula islandica]